MEREIASIATLVLIPIVIGFLGAFTTEIYKSYGNVVYAIWTVVLVLLGLFWWRWNPADESVLELIVENERLERQLATSNSTIEQLSQSIGLLSLQVTYSNSTWPMVLEHSRREILTLGDLRESISEIATPLDLQGEFAFGFAPAERWSFAVYLYSERQDLLLPVWREKAKTHPSLDAGRTWGRGEGHVGKAFVDRKAIITGNSRNPAAAELSALPPGRENAYDKDVYISFAAVPVGPLLKDENRPYGVLVGTSDRVDRFDREKAGLLIQIADGIAGLIATSRLDFDLLLTAEAENDHQAGGQHDQD